MRLEDITEKAKYQKENWEELDGKIESLDVTTREITVNGMDLVLSELAFNQALDRLGMPYTCKEFKGDNFYIQEGVNKKVKSLYEKKRISPQRLIFDIKTKEVKAIRTTKYKRLFNADLIATVVKRFGTNIDERFSFVDDLRLVIAFREVSQAETKVGEIVGFGVEIRNSEAGIMRLGACQYLLRKVCGNGAIAPIKEMEVQIYHVYDDIYPRFLQLCTSLIDTSSTMTLINRSINRPALTTIDKIPELLTHFAVQKRYHDGILSALSEEKIGITDDGVNGWAIHNAITRYVSHAYLESDKYEPWLAQQLMLQAYQFLKV